MAAQLRTSRHLLMMIKQRAQLSTCRHSHQARLANARLAEDDDFFESLLLDGGGGEGGRQQWG